MIATGGTMKSYTCEGCYGEVSSDRAFLRSINLRTLAWCRDCWFERHPELGIVPQQRQAPAAETAARRWKLQG